MQLDKWDLMNYNFLNQQKNSTSENKIGVAYH